MDQKKNNNVWVYYNGELYHAGVKGMHWHQHLPGTDWWKDLGGKVTKAYNVASSKFRTARDKAIMKGYQIGRGIQRKANKISYKVKKGTSKLWNEAKGYSSDKIKELKRFAKDAYKSVRESVHNYFKASLHSQFKTDVTRTTSITLLDQFQSKQMRDAVSVYQQGKVNGSFGNTLNQWFQNAQYGIVAGCNKYLKQFNLDDDVDKFMRKLLGKERPQRRKPNSKANEFYEKYENKHRI